MRFITGFLCIALTVASIGRVDSRAAGLVPLRAPFGAASGSRMLRFPLGPRSIVPRRRGVFASVSASAAMCAKPSDAVHVSCFAAVRPDSVVTSAFPDAIFGLTPYDLSSIYGYASPGSQGTAGAGKTVAVVVAGDYALAEADLGVYRSRFGLPACTKANGCLVKVGAAATDQSSPTTSGASVSAHPTTTAAVGWAAETDADTETVSAVCPNCRIMIAEAASSSLGDLTSAVGVAIASGASIVNTSFGTPESSVDAQYTSTYENSRGVKIVAASGDWGYGVYFPASDPKVVAVGGTSLNIFGNYVGETVWAGTGSGCSKVFARPSWQTAPAFYGTCGMRTVADVAAVADPDTGVAIYDSSLFGSYGGWATFGGTSISAPIITGMFAVSGDTATGSGAQKLYANSWFFQSILIGSNGICFPTYLCQAGMGYSGPTGIGVPKNLGGF